VTFDSIDLNLREAEHSLWNQQIEAYIMRALTAEGPGNKHSKIRKTVQKIEGRRISELFRACHKLDHERK
jgi:hypothetical protein